MTQDQIINLLNTPGFISATIETDTGKIWLANIKLGPKALEAVSTLHMEHTNHRNAAESLGEEHHADY